MDFFWPPQLSPKPKQTLWYNCQLLVSSCKVAQMADTMGVQMTGFREEKSTMSWRVTEWNSKWDDRDALTTREQAEKEREKGGRGKEGRNTMANAHTEKTRCFPASRCDGRRPLTNKSEAVKRQDAEKGIQRDVTPHSGLVREERRVGNAGADAHTQRKKSETSLA